jgi:ribonuclease III
VRDRALLAQALVHRSFTNEHPGAPLRSNDRLEFLGDAVIALVFSEALYARYPDEDEGPLTTRRSAMISTAGLSRLAERIDLGPSLILGAGADRADERRRASVLESSFEALVGALYLDQGLDVTRRWLLDLAEAELAAQPSAHRLKPAKSQLQERAYQETGAGPVYRVLSAEGPDHLKEYVVEVRIQDVPLAVGRGRNRRDAETEAAVLALHALDEWARAGRNGEEREGPPEATRADVPVAAVPPPSVGSAGAGGVDAHSAPGAVE